MKIEVRGKNVEVTDELREAVIQRFQRVGKQVSEFATLEVELCEEKNPRIADRSRLPSLVWSSATCAALTNGCSGSCLTVWPLSIGPIAS